MKKITIDPAEQRVVILPDETREERTPSGIIIPKTAQEDKPGFGTIVSTGSGSIDHPMNYYIGQRVLFSNYAGLEVELDILGHGRATYKVMNQADIMAKIQEVD